MHRVEAGHGGGHLVTLCPGAPLFQRPSMQQCVGNAGLAKMHHIHVACDRLSPSCLLACLLAHTHSAVRAVPRGIYPPTGAPTKCACGDNCGCEEGCKCASCKH